MIRALVAALVLLPALASAQGNNIDVKISGLHCESCVESVKESLAKLPAVEKGSIQVSLKENKATIQVAKADKATIEAVKKAVVDAGFKVVGEPKVSAN